MAQAISRNQQWLWRLQELAISTIIFTFVMLVMTICDARISYYEKLYYTPIKVTVEKQPQELVTQAITEKMPQEESLIVQETSKVVQIPEIVEEVETATTAQEETKLVNPNADLDHEIYMLAKGIHGEGSVCDSAEQYRIGTVIMNRVAHKRYPNDVEGVLAEGYSCYKDNRWYAEEPTAEEIKIAKDIYANGTRVFGPEVIYQAKQCCGKCVYESNWHQYGVDE